MKQSVDVDVDVAVDVAVDGDTRGGACYDFLVIDLEHLGPERVRPLYRAEYDQLVKLGAFDDERLELLGGVIVAMSPIGTAHAYSVYRLNSFLTPALASRAHVHIRSPFAASDDSEPEPDVAVVPPGEYLDDHPSEAWLIIEVAESSLAKDREIKLPLYASSGVPEVWIVNLVEDVIEVHREPAHGSYASRSAFRRGDSIALLRFPDLVVDVATVLPPAR